MKGLTKKWWFWLIIIFLVLMILILIFSTRKNVDGRLGGIVKGPSHEEGGIRVEIRSNGEAIEMEGGEAIINKDSMSMKERVVCEGTPAGIASGVNELGGGIRFDNNGMCWIK